MAGVGIIVLGLMEIDWLGWLAGAWIEREHGVNGTRLCKLAGWLAGWLAYSVGCGADSLLGRPRGLFVWYYLPLDEP